MTELERGPVTSRDPTGSTSLVGESDAMHRVRALIGRVAHTDASVLVIGESGTGKELVAQALHAGSARATSELHAVNCGAIPPTLIEAELFGYEKGSFTGATRTHDGIAARASGGTLFLDEITEMPMEMQPPLLRFLETQRFFRVGGTRELSTDVRFVAATNRSPVAAVRENRLREDLYYRIAVFPIELPPLRTRGDDVVELAELFLERLNERSDRKKRFSPSSLDAARQYGWPGNVRELKHAVEYAYIMGDREIDLSAAIGRASDLTGPPLPEASSRDGEVRVRIGSRLCDAERSVIEATLARLAGNKRRTAEVLGCSVKTLYNKLNSYARLAGRV